MENYARGSTNETFDFLNYGLMEYEELKESIARESRECEELRNSINTKLSELKRMNIENSKKHHEKKQKIIDLEYEILKVSHKIKDISEANTELNNLRITPRLAEQ